MKLKAFFVFLGVITFDQATKWWARMGLVGHGVILNNGFSFGLHYFSPWFSMIVLVFVWSAIAWLFLQKIPSSPFIAALILGGGFANLIDRVVWGGVIDWCPLPLVGLQNNFADQAISLGFIGFVVRIYLTWSRHK